MTGRQSIVAGRSLVEQTDGSEGSDLDKEPLLQPESIRTRFSKNDDGSRSQLIGEDGETEGEGRRGQPQCSDLGDRPRDVTEMLEPFVYRPSQAPASRDKLEPNHGTLVCVDASNDLAAPVVLTSERHPHEVSVKPRG